MAGRAGALAVMVVVALSALGMRAQAETKIYRAAQVQIDIRDDWKIDSANNILVVTDPGSNVILVVEVLEASALDSAIKDADSIIRKYVTRVVWKKKPTNRNLNGMKALAFDGGGLLKGNRVDIGALIVTTPSHKTMLMFGFMASAQSARLQPQVDALVNSIKPLAAESSRREPPPQPPSRPEPQPPESPRQPQQPAQPPQQPPSTDAEGLPLATGFSVQYIPPASPKLQPLLTFARNAGLEPFVDELNQAFVLPRLIPIEVRECGTPNAYYSEYLHVVRVCYELVVEVFGTLRPTAASDAEAVKLAAGVIKFTLMHELTHALTHELDIPIAGREEDAADDFAALLLTFEKDDTGFDAAYAASRFFEARGNTELKSGGVAWYDEHSFGLQRTNAILCILYGADKAKYKRVVKGQIGPPQDYLDHRCVAQYPHLRGTWSTLLRSHMRN